MCDRDVKEMNHFQAFMDGTSFHMAGLQLTLVIQATPQIV